MLPPVVAQRMPEITKEMALLCCKMRDQRLLILKDNEESLAEESKPDSDEEVEEDDNEEDNEEDKED